MCEFCHRHGEGKKWYLQAKNYSEDLLSDIRRRQYIAHFMSQPERAAHGVAQLGRVEKLPSFVQTVVTPYLSNRQKKVHFGQVVPIEECEQIFAFVTSVVRIACLCRHNTVGTEQRYCYGVSMAPMGGEIAKIIREIDVNYLTGPDTAGLEILSKEDALTSFREHEREGLCHTVWTFITPFIGGICNCDRTDCLAMRATLTNNVPVMFRAEFIAEANQDLCNGCRQCMRVCQFGAIGYSAANKKVFIDQYRCYGCGICRTSCEKDAIMLYDRSSVPVAANKW